MGLSNRVWVVGAVAAAGLGGAALGAAASGGSGTIHGCYAKRGGALRIAGHCRASEKAIMWNKQGPPGTARAYAYVKGGVAGSATDKASLVAARTHGFTSVREPQNGIYCLTAAGINAADTAPVLSAVYNSGFAGIPTAVRLYTTGTECGTNQFEVMTDAIESSGSGGFDERPSPNLDFTIVVP